MQYFQVRCITSPTLAAQFKYHVIPTYTQYFGIAKLILKFQLLALQLEEELQSDLLWSILIKKVLHSGKSKFQSMELAESGPFGKVLASQP